MKLLEGSRYKDDYYKLLGFVGALAEEMGSIPAIKKTTNRELLRIMSPDGVYPSLGMKRNNEDIEKILLKVEAFLSEIELNGNEKDKKTCMLNSFLQKKHEIFRPISQKQISKAKSVMKYLASDEFNDALHEFAECIADNETGLNSQKNMSVNEYSVYVILTQSFLARLENKKEK